MTRTLIFGTSYCATPERRDLTILWAKLVTKLNPGADILLVDSASPFDPCVFLTDQGFKEWPFSTVTAEDFKTEPRVIRFPDNIGHLGGGGKDGWGRAFCMGLQYAGERHYSQVAYIDADILFAKPVAPIFRRMAQQRVPVTCPLDMNYQFLENGLVFMNRDMLDTDDFIRRYDWQNAKPYPFPEVRFEELLPDIFTIPLRGCRNDWHAVTAENIRQAFPMGCDYITHCRDPQVYQAFLHINGLEV